jgi:hypothetical protein
MPQGAPERIRMCCERGNCWGSKVSIRLKVSATYERTSSRVGRLRELSTIERRPSISQVGRSGRILSDSVKKTQRGFRVKMGVLETD